MFISENIESAIACKHETRKNIKKRNKYISILNTKNIPQNLQK